MGALGTDSGPTVTCPHHGDKTPWRVKGKQLGSKQEPDGHLAGAAASPVWSQPSWETVLRAASGLSPLPGPAQLPPEGTSFLSFLFHKLHSNVSPKSLLSSHIVGA